MAIKKWIRRKSNQRLCLYVSIAAITALIADLSTGGIISATGWVVLGLNAMLQALIAWRAYIDESPANGGSEDTTKDIVRHKLNI